MGSKKNDVPCLPPRSLILFGGSFDPPHLAHVLAACLARSLFPSAPIWVIPTYKHPFSKKLESYTHRITMCDLAFSWIPHLRVSRIEKELGGVSRTFRLVTHLKHELPDVSLRLLIGSDILSEASNWYGWDAICEVAPLIVLRRRGSPLTQNLKMGDKAQSSQASHFFYRSSLLPAISSSQIRNLITNLNKPNKLNDPNKLKKNVKTSEKNQDSDRLALLALLPKKVIDYIDKNNLYTAS